MDRFKLELDSAGERKITMQTRPNVLQGFLDLLTYSPNQCASMIHKLYLDVRAFPQPEDHQGVIGFLHLLPALRHLTVFGGGSLDAAGIRIFQRLLSCSDSDRNTLAVGETVSLSARSLSRGYFPFHWLVKQGILSTSVPINHLPAIVIKQIQFIRSSGSQSTDYKLRALEVELSSGSMPAGGIPFLLGSDFATTLEHLHIHRSVVDPSMFFSSFLQQFSLMRMIYLFSFNNSGT
jgi:hypothetical protein